MEPDYFERLLDAFARDPSLGIASGSAWELDDGVWRQRFVTGGTVWGATRAYRWECLQEVLPLEERHGWDGIDQLKARARGWHTTTLTDLPFRHHRAEGLGDGSTWAHWAANGDTAYFMGYRPWYLLAHAAPVAAGPVGVRVASWVCVCGTPPLAAARGSVRAQSFARIRASARSFIADGRPLV